MLAGVSCLHDSAKHADKLAALDSELRDSVRGSQVSSQHGSGGLDRSKGVHAKRQGKHSPVQPTHTSRAMTSTAVGHRI